MLGQRNDDHDGNENDDDGSYQDRDVHERCHARRASPRNRKLISRATARCVAGSSPPRAL
jgi:hypothetical protein